MAKTQKRSNRIRRIKAIRLPRSVKKLFPQVESCYDAKVAVDVSVSKKDCEEAVMLDPSQCALARAAKREHHVDGVVIGMTTSYLIKGNEAVRFATPMAVQKEIVSFDRHKDFAPGDYHLIPKSPSSRFGEPSHYKPDHGRNKEARRKIHKSARIRLLDKGSAIYG